MMQRWGQVTEQPALAAVSSGSELLALRSEVDQVHVSPVVQHYILTLVRATRTLADNPGALGAPAELRGVPARLPRALPGRALPRPAAGPRLPPPRPGPRSSPPDVLRHRIGLTYEAEAQEVTPDTIISQVVVCDPGSARLMLPATSQAENPLALLRQLEWRVRHAVENILSGEYRSAFRGRGIEFDQVVRYEFGDDVRDIDWNVTARLGEPYRKKFVEEREVTLLLVLEDSPSLNFGSGAHSKREALLELAGLVMLLGAVNGDRVGFVHALPDGPVFREPVRGRGAIMHAAASLIAGAAPSAAAAATPEMPWRFIARAAPKHSVLIWLGDLPPRPEPEGWVRPGASGATRRWCSGSTTRGMRALPSEGRISAYDPSSGRLVTLDGGGADRAAHAEWRSRRDEAWEALFPDPLSRLVVSAADDRFDALVRFFHARMRAGGSRGQW